MHEDDQMSATHITTVRAIACIDDRDELTGKAIPFGIAFDFEGPGGRVTWSLNTGWVDRPVQTNELRLGKQQRSDKPGVDATRARDFPKPMDVHILPAGAVDPDDGWSIDTHSEELLRTLVRDGQEAVFDTLRRLYDEHLAGAV